MTTTPQMRVITHTAPTTVPGATAARPSQPIQHRIVTVRIITNLIYK